MTTIAQLQNQQISLRDRALTLNPPLEIIPLAPQAYFGFEVQEGTHIKKMTCKLTPTTVYKDLKLEVSNDGTHWTTVATEPKYDVLQATVNQTTKFIRIINTTSETLEVKMELFKVEVQ